MFLMDPFLQTNASVHFNCWILSIYHCNIVWVFLFLCTKDDVLALCFHASVGGRDVAGKCGWMPPISPSITHPAEQECSLGLCEI
jgi:nitric oxide synthase oxygenase domain/subunit